MEKEILKSFIIPILDFSPHSPYNINTLLDDLSQVKGEVICIFNSDQVFDVLKEHPRIDKFCYNNLNAGVSRSWNIGLNMAEGDIAYILNSDLHIQPETIEKMNSYMFQLEKAVLIGPEGAMVDFQKMEDKTRFRKGDFHSPQRVHAVSGFLFAIHRQRFLDANLSFDVRFSPCFTEEWDIGLQIIKAGLSAYVVPVHGYAHDWGISAKVENCAINYFGRLVNRNDVLVNNRKKFLSKWFSTAFAKG